MPDPGRPLRLLLRRSLVSEARSLAKLLAFGGVMPTAFLASRSWGPVRLPPDSPVQERPRPVGGQAHQRAPALGSDNWRT
jgi:hypothetical protein